LANFDRQFFDAGSATPGTFPSYTWDEFRPEMEDLANALVALFRPRRVLSVGCGKGFLLRALAPLQVEVQGVDISAYALGEAPAWLQPFLHQLDIGVERLPFPDASFDVVACLGTLEYLRDPVFAAREMVRVRGTDGVIVFKTIFRATAPGDLRIGIHSRSWWLRFWRELGLVVDWRLQDAIVRIQIRRALNESRSRKAGLLRVARALTGPLAERSALALYPAIARRTHTTPLFVFRRPAY
jgi:SAM-dependent methyltransferase